MVEAISKEVPNKIITKGGKKPQSKAFADFINDLGKTTNIKKISAESALDSAPKMQKLQNPKEPPTNSSIVDDKSGLRSHERENRTNGSFAKRVASLHDLSPQDEFGLLGMKSKSPLESILSRPQATQTKLNQTPQIADSADSQNLDKNKSHKAQNAESSVNSAEKSTNKDFKTNLQNRDSAPKAENGKMGKIAENGKAMETLDSAIQNDKARNLANTKDNIAESSLDSAPKIAQNPQKPPLDSAKNDDLRGNPPLENSTESQSGWLLRDARKSYGLPRSLTLARNDGLFGADSAPSKHEANSSIVDDKSGLRSHEREDRTNGSSTKRVASLPDLSPQDEFAPNLGIKNTLKYGAFKAFDALSLLKPSDGKKLSDLIKKADELALNLQNIKYTKMGENKGVFGLDSAKQNLDKIQSREAQPLKASSGEGVGVVREGEGSDFAIQAPAPSLKKNARSEKGESSADLSAQGRKENRDSSVASLPQNDKVKKTENDKVKEVSDSIKVDTTKTNSAESKPAESPLKSALETENSDIKPINLKAQNIAESKKETPLDSIKDAIKDSAKDAKDTPKPAQENAPLTDAQSTSKIANKMFDARESMRHFAYALKQEIQNHKPPLSKITIELQPANLGSVEVSIISQGKNIQIQLHSNQQTLNLFIQNQSDLRSALSQIGYENVAMSFNNGAQMGFSDNSGKWRYESAQKSRNTFSFNESNDEGDEVFEIMITNNYA